MDFKETDKFYEYSIEYCSVIENFKTNGDKGKLRRTLNSLSCLYMQVLKLPNCETESDTELDITLQLPKLDLGEYDIYWNIYEPYRHEEPINGSLVDDLLDIYRDVKVGTILYEKTDKREANWYWKFNFEIHWGKHAVNGLRVLHDICY
ncbi:hypothetical protein CN918_28030 [Priestia megaterium]|nr:hypothetical protein CN918_28030 [Priestia megaterium]